MTPGTEAVDGVLEAPPLQCIGQECGPAIAADAPFHYYDVTLGKVQGLQLVRAKPHLLYVVEAEDPIGLDIRGSKVRSAHIAVGRQRLEHLAQRHSSDILDLCD
jgi:hypothetical protein